MWPGIALFERKYEVTLALGVGRAGCRRPENAAMSEEVRLDLGSGGNESRRKLGLAALLSDTLVGPRCLDVPPFVAPVPS